MKPAQRLDGIGEYYFSQKLREIDEMNRHGTPVINLGIGSPDLPPHPDVISILQTEAAKANTHAYQSYKGAPVFRQAIARWYGEWYGVSLDLEREILPLIGSKEGIMHICMAYLNEGDGALVPDPGYPTYRSAVQLAGGKCIEYTLKEEHQWMPDWEALEAMDLSNVKMMWVNYPHMPTGQLGNQDLFERLIDFGRRHQVLICHDNPYSFILNDRPASILSVPGAKEIAIELNSLSKSHNMAGWRVGMMCSSREHIEQVLRFKSNMDSGMFLPVQLAAAHALGLPSSWYEDINKEYRQRREKAWQLLRMLHLNFDQGQAGMFVWARVGEDFDDGFQCADHVLQQARVFITPGGIFGPSGNRYVRLSLCSSIEKLEQAMGRIGEMIRNNVNA